ncbi:MAG: CPBP family intramembrane metalloprotease [Pirellulaceae bacterium]|nr:CPBP family intramembrane metalloprotease [Pirellulaceae bacterium]
MRQTPEITPEMLQQHPSLLLYMMFIGLLVFTILISSLASWAWLLYRQSHGQPWIPRRLGWQPSCWSLFDVLLIAGFVVLLQLGPASWALRAMGIGSQGQMSLEAMAVGGAASLMGVFLGVAWIIARYRRSIEHVGLGAIPVSLLALSMAAGLAMLPLVYLMMTAISLMSQSEYSHPLIESAQASGSLTGFLLAFFAAVVAAPLTEEFLFRGMLQGWLQSIPFKSLLTNVLGVTPQSQAMPPSVIEPPLADASAGHATAFPSEMTEVVAKVEAVPAVWPAVVTGILFGLAHISYGMSFVPLSVLGIFLGLVYRQTQSLWPCVLIHMLLNSISMLMLGLIIFVTQIAG